MCIRDSYYAAPETLLRGEEEFRTDMYALGATMYHLLVGAPPRVDASQSSDVLQMCIRDREREAEKAAE